uniref:Uncharacterized protein n=1 Tax=Anguilla anguilla TaxID=7936 RepID=A0A0E9W714_ANGAN
MMIGFQPNKFWRVCWAFVTPTILTVCPTMPTQLDIVLSYVIIVPIHYMFNISHFTTGK